MLCLYTFSEQNKITALAVSMKMIKKRWKGLNEEKYRNTYLITMLRPKQTASVDIAHFN